MILHVTDVCANSYSATDSCVHRECDKRGYKVRRTPCVPREVITEDYALTTVECQEAQNESRF